MHVAQGGDHSELPPIAAVGSPGLGGCRKGWSRHLVWWRGQPAPTCPGDLNLIARTMTKPRENRSSDPALGDRQAAAGGACPSPAS
jgi:hypothetical protein